MGDATTDTGPTDLVGIPEATEEPSPELAAFIARMRAAVDEADARAAEEAAELAAANPPGVDGAAASSAVLGPEGRPDVREMLRELAERNEREAEASRIEAEAQAARDRAAAEAAAAEARANEERIARMETALARIEATLSVIEAQTRPTTPV